MAKESLKGEEESNTVNATTKEDSDDALVLCVDNPIESWILIQVFLFILPLAEN